MSTGSGQFHNRQPPFWSPLNLSGRVLDVGETLAIGALGAPQGVAIRNQNKGAMLIDQFKFVGPALLGADLTEPMGFRTAQLAANIMLGAIPLTNSFVPLMAMCPTYYGVQTNNRAACQFSLIWHLPRPIYVPPNVAVSAQFTQRALSDTVFGASFNGPLWFSVVGRSLPDDYQIPPEIFVPWVTHTRNTSPTDTVFTSADRDLINPFPQPLKVTRFIGHAPFITYSGSTVSEIFSSLPVPLTLQMSLSSNSILVQSETPFYSVFTPARRNADVDGILQANEFVRARVEAPSGFSTGATANLGMADMSIGMIGYRVLKTPQGSWT